MDKVPTGTAETGTRTTGSFTSQMAHSMGRVSGKGEIGTNMHTKVITGINPRIRCRVTGIMIIIIGDT